MHIDLQSEKTTGISAARHIRSFNEAENVLVTSNFIIQLATNINIISVCLYRQTNSPQQKQYLSLIENRCKVFQLVSLSTGLEKKFCLLVVSVYSLKSFSGNSFTSSVEASVTEDKGQEFFMTLMTEHLGNIFIPVSQK